MGHRADRVDWAHLRSDQAVRRPLLSVYDYGQGAVWCFIVAESPAEVVARYPDLTVVDEPPAWMTEETLSRIRERMTLDLDDTENEFLASLRDNPDQPG